MSGKRYSYKKDGGVKLSAHFAVREFRCADGTDGILIDDALVAALEHIREHFGKSVKISSAYRTAVHQAKVSIDSKFGPNTKAALIAFQKTHGLPTDALPEPRRVRH